jgi:hypothetical protein
MVEATARGLVELGVPEADGRDLRTTVRVDGRRRRRLISRGGAGADLPTNTAKQAEYVVKARGRRAVRRRAEQLAKVRRSTPPAAR